MARLERGFERLPEQSTAVHGESLLLKHQLLILNRSRRRAPKLRALDRILLGRARCSRHLNLYKKSQSPSGLRRCCDFTEHSSAQSINGPISTKARYRPGTMLNQ